MYTEIKYLNLYSPRFDRFSQKKDYLWDFRCPICGDSQRNKTKAAGSSFGSRVTWFTSAQLSSMNAFPQVVGDVGH